MAGIVGAQRSSGGPLAALLNLAKDPEKLEQRISRYETAKEEAVAAEAAARAVQKELSAAQAQHRAGVDAWKAQQERELAELHRIESDLDRRAAAISASEEEIATMRASLARDQQDLTRQRLAMERGAKDTADRFKREAGDLQERQRLLAVATEQCRKDEEMLADRREKLEALEAAIQSYLGA